MKNWFNFNHLRGDLLGGITAGVVALPLALAFGASTDLGAAAGLYGAIFIGFFAALFGGTNTQISGPTAPMTAVSLVVITGIMASFDGSIEKALPVILMVFLAAGLIQILLGFLGVGTYIKYIPYPVVSGFMTAIGVLILFGESYKVLGYYPEDDTGFVQQFKPEAEEKLLDKILQKEAKDGILVLESFEETMKRSSEVNPKTINEESTILAKKDTSNVLGKIKNFPNALNNIIWSEVLLALLTIALIYGFKRITTTIPSTLIALILVSLGAFLFKEFNGFVYKEIEPIPKGFPKLLIGEMFGGFSLNAFTPYIGSAVSLAFLGAIDSLLTSVVADNMTKTKHNPNQELIGQGVGNSIAAIFKGLPGAGATIRTVVNINAGGKTRVSGMIAAALLLIISLFVSGAASQIPQAVLSGILVTVGIGVMDYKGLRAIPSMQKDINLFNGRFKLSSEVLILFTVLILSVVWDLIYAVGIGLVFASLMFMKKMGDITKQESKAEQLTEADEEIWEDEKDFPQNLKEEVFIKHLNGPLFFGYVNDFRELASNLPEHTQTIVIRMEEVPYIDQSGLYAFEEILLDFKNKGKAILIIGANETLMLRFRAIDIIPNLITEDHVFETIPEAFNWIKNNVKDTV